MPEGNGTGATPATPATGAEPGNEPKQGQQPQGGQPATATGAEGGDQLGEAGKLAIAREREARRQAEKNYEELAARLKAIEEKDLPEAEKVKRRGEELEAENRTLRQQNRDLQVRSTIEAAATRLGFADPTDASRLVDLGELDFDKDGNPRGVDEALKELLKNKPYLKAAASRPQGSGDGGGAATPPAADNMNSLIRQAAGRTN